MRTTDHEMISTSPRRCRVGYSQGYRLICKVEIIAIDGQAAHGRGKVSRGTCLIAGQAHSGKRGSPARTAG